MSRAGSKHKAVKKEIIKLNRRLKVINSERDFVWNTPKYQEAHMQLLDEQEEKITRRLEALKNGN